MGTLHLTIGLTASALSIAACRGVAPSGRRVAAKYDQTSGKLGQVTISGEKDGKPNIYSYMDGNAFVRIEIDQDEDGKIDRWEYYGPTQELTKVGMSRLNDGKPGLWVFAGPDGTVNRVEVSTRGDGVANRTEYYANGRIARAEEDTNGDGRFDKWEMYEGEALTAVSFDTTNSGKPTITVDYKVERTSSVSGAPPR